MEISTPETKVILIDAYGSETELPLEEAIYELSWLGEGIIWISPKLAFYRAEGAPRSDEYLLSRDPRLLKRFEK
ncbi:MAG: hypothetical protein EA376_08230 [Phycisphaeraceae bacterium]|nr:MAG: hypothetical protein EA376_08230 [Phycisphaeraceae bacterium]